MFARHQTWLLAVLCVVGACPAASAQQFFLKKGDVVVVMGDSITEQRLYSNYVELWSQTRFPDYGLVFRNVGIGGDRSTGGNGRFKRDVLPHKPTVLTVDFGMNDGNYQAFNDKTFATYMNGLQGIADQAKAANIRVAWVTPQPTERREPGDQLAGYNETLKKFSEGVGEIAKKNDGLFVDQFTPYLAVMNKARATDPKILVTGGDAVHPGPPGQALMAAAILKGMSFPRAVSSVVIDAAGKVEATNCKVTEVDTKNGVRFQRHDAALPYFPEPAQGILKWAPLLEEMNDYGLKVTGLKAGKYAVRLGGQTVAEYDAAALAKGVNLAGPALATGPVAEQVKAVVKAVNDKTNFYHGQIFRGLVLANAAGLAKLPEFKDVAKDQLEKRKQEVIEERSRKMPALDGAVRKALEMRPHLVEVVPVQSVKASADGWVELLGDHLDAWRPPVGTWIHADSVGIDPENPKKLVAKPGKGIWVNGPAGKTRDLLSREAFGDVELHVEFMIPKGSNSGVKLHGHYEIQILDSFGVKEDKLTGDSCGGIYPRAELKPKYHHIDKGTAPRVNACKAPGEWQTLDIVFVAPKFDGEKKKVANAKFVKVVLNGQVIHENVELLTPTGNLYTRPEVATGPILLQADHGAVAFRNVKVRAVK